MNLIDDLKELDGQMLGRKHFIVTVGHDYLAGRPYPTTSFGERAFVFGSRADAQRIIDRHFAGKDTKIIECS